MNDEEILNVDIVEIDIGELKTLGEQQDCCIQMLDELLRREKILRNRISCIQTVNNMLQSEDILMKELGEFVGYHYGRLHTSLSSASTALMNLNGFADGELDDMDHGARSIYLGLWYNIGAAGLNAIEDCVYELEKIEMDLIEMAPKTDDGHYTIKGETIH